MSEKKRTNEEQLELFADMLEPAAEIISDKDVAAMLRNGEKRVAAISLAIKKHKSAVVRILAALDGENAETYRVPPPAGLIAKILNIFNDPELQELFTGQQQRTDAAVSGAATEITEGGAN